jgi:hypothetical protein
MDPCHTKPFLKPGVVVDTSRKTVFAEPEDPTGEVCDYCGLATLEWRKCKLVCTNCRQINRSCADL